MTIKARLLLSSALMVGGVALVAALSLYATTSIKKSINQLTSSSTPVQIKTTELQKTIESLSGTLLRLGVSNDPQEVRQLTEAVENHKKTIETIVSEIKGLTSSGAADIDMSLFENLHQVLSRAVEQRLTNIALFKTDTANVDASLQLVEKAMLEIRNEMTSLSSSSNTKVGEAVRSSSDLFSGTNIIKDMMIDMREIMVTLNDLDLARTKPEVLALKQKIRALNNSIQRVKFDDQAVAEVKEKVAGIHDQFVRDGSGLIALKMDVLGGKPADSQFQSIKKQIANTLTELNLRLVTVVDTMESRVARNRNEVSGALGSGQKVGLVTDTVNSVSVDMKSLNAKVRILMLSDSDESYNRAVAEIRSTLARLTQGLATGKKEISGFKQEKLSRSMDGAAEALKKTEGSIHRIIESQRKILASNSLVNKTVAEVKSATLREIKAGEERVRETAGRQEAMVADVNSMVTRLSTLIMIVSFIVAVGAVVGSIGIFSRINKSMHRMIDMLRDIAGGEGDLTKRLDATAKDEFGEAARWFNAFLAKLSGIISTVAGNTSQLATASGKLQDTAKQMMAGAGEVAAQTDGLATASNEMASTSADIAKNCLTAADGAVQTEQAAVSGAAVVGETIRVMGRIAEQVANGSHMVGSLGKRSDQIGAIVITIKDIADQTNLLALNAAIEAARAGEQGRGFAVVADEVRLLAEKTTAATQEIAEMIKAIQSEIGSAVSAMEAGVAEVEQGKKDADKSRTALDKILAQIREVSMQVNQIATAAEQQTATTDEINNNIHRITKVVQQTSAGAQESSSSASSLAHLAEDLQKLVGQFKLA